MIKPYTRSLITDSVIVLRRGGVVAYPTDTLYGLGASPDSELGIAKILKVKGRSPQKGLPLLLSGTDVMHTMIHSVSPLAEALAEAFWPGPLTLVLRSDRAFPELLSGDGSRTVALRVPDHAIALELANDLGGCIIGTSANLSGGTELVTATDVDRTFGCSIDYVIDGGPAYKGKASTVIDVTGLCPRVIRLGALTLNAIKAVCGQKLEMPDA